MVPETSPKIQSLIETTTPLFAATPAIEAVYLFGSTADGTADERSDLDFGILCARETDRLACGRLQMELAGRLSLLLRTDRIDVVILNTTRSIELSYAVIEDGVQIYNRGVDLDEFEMRIRHEYEDHLSARRRLRLDVN